MFSVFILFQDEDGASGEDGEGEVDLEEEADHDKLWEEVDKGLTALQGEYVLCYWSYDRPNELFVTLIAS